MCCIIKQKEINLERDSSKTDKHALLGGGRGDMGVGAWQLLTFEFFTVGDINPGVPNGSKSINGNQSNYKLIISC